MSFLLMASTRPAQTVQEAVRSAPSLSRLLSRLDTSQQYLACVQPLLDTTLLPALFAGPVDENQWCLIVKGNAIAAKLKQQLPALVSHLQSKGYPVTTIRLKVLAAV